MPTPTATATFEHLMNLESAIRSERASATFGVTFDQRGRAFERMQATQRTLFAALDALSHTKQVEFGHYRAAAIRATHTD